MTSPRAFKSGGVHLVSVPIDYSENTRVLIDELREKLKQVDESAASAGLRCGMASVVFCQD